MSTERKFAMAENGLVSRIEVGLMVDSLLLEIGEQMERKPLKILEDLKKNKVSFVGFSGTSHGY